MDFFLNTINHILIFIILAQSYNLVLGYTGMIHVGHIAFMAIGAYSSSLLVLAGFPFWIGLLAGIAAAALAGLILGIPTVRFREDYLVAATLGIGEIIRLILLNERQITGGSTGLTKIPRPDLFGISFESNLELLPFIFIITVLALLIMWRIIHSPFGRVLQAIREDEVAAKSLGKNAWVRKLQVLIIGALFAGLAGVLYAHTNQFIDPDARTFGLDRMIYVFLIVVFGGSGTFWGPVLGTTILYAFFEGLRFVPLPPHVLGPLRWVIFSSILIAMIIYKPKGIISEKLVRKKL